MCVQSVILRVFPRGHCKYLFVSGQNDANYQLVNIFEQLFRMTEFSMKVRFTQLWVIAIFEHKHFTMLYSDALRYGGMFNYCFAKNLLLNLLVKEF